MPMSQKKKEGKDKDKVIFNKEILDATVLDNQE